MKRAIGAALLALAATSAAAQEGGVCRDDRLDIRGDWGTARFGVAVADDAAERARGLMFVEELGPRQGMIFAYEREEPVAFWMRNTLIPLDMIFADASGTVIKVHPEAVPGDLTPIPSDGPAQFVLEIPGGRAADLGIDVGSQMRHPSIPTRGTGPAWPCD